MSITTDNETVDAVARARALHGLVDEQAAASEDLGQLTPDIDYALHAQGLYGMWVPKSLGGLELDPITSLEVLETVSYAQPSAGWVLMAAGLSVGTGAAYLGSITAEVERPSRVRLPLAAGEEADPLQMLRRWLETQPFTPDRQALLLRYAEALTKSEE